MTEVDIRRAVRFLGTDHSQPECAVELTHLLSAVFPKPHLGLSVHIGEIVCMVEDRFRRAQVSLKMMPGAAECGADVSKALKLFVTRKSRGGIKVAFKSKQILDGVQILRTAQTPVRDAASFVLRAVLRADELLFDP